jgi:hypothetical protein
MTDTTNFRALCQQVLGYPRLKLTTDPELLQKSSFFADKYNDKWIKIKSWMEPNE